MTRLTLYTKPGCHLCDEMKAVIARVGHHVPIALEEIDISTNEDLTRRYGTDIPVLLIDDRPGAKHRIGDDDLLRRICARA